MLKALQRKAFKNYVAAYDSFARFRPFTTHCLPAAPQPFLFCVVFSRIFMIFATLFTQSTASYAPDFFCGLVWFLILLFGSLWFVGYFDTTPATAPVSNIPDLGVELEPETLKNTIQTVLAKESATVKPVKNAARKTTQLSTVQTTPKKATTKKKSASKKQTAQEINPNNNWSRPFLTSLGIRQLKTLASFKQVKNYSSLRKHELVDAMAEAATVIPLIKEQAIA